MEINKKKAPQNKVLGISRVGRWGSVCYIHSLDCGHLEERKRPAKTEFIACAKCVMAEDFAEKTKDLVRFGVGYESITEIDMTPDPLEIVFSSSEANVDRTKNRIAEVFGVQADDVSVFVEQDENMLITGATVFISAIDIARICGSD